MGVCVCVEGGDNQRPQPSSNIRDREFYTLLHSQQSSARVADSYPHRRKHPAPSGGRCTSLGSPPAACACLPSLTSSGHVVGLQLRNQRLGQGAAGDLEGGWVVVVREMPWGGGCRSCGNGVGCAGLGEGGNTWEECQRWRLWMISGQVWGDTGSSRFGGEEAQGPGRRGQRVQCCQVGGGSAGTTACSSLCWVQLGQLRWS